MLDKQHVKSKSHKNSLAAFTKCILELGDQPPPADADQPIEIKNEAYFEVLVEVCFFSNSPAQQFSTQASSSLNMNLGDVGAVSQAELHDAFVDRLQFFIDTLGLLNGYHVN